MFHPLHAMDPSDSLMIAAPDLAELPQGIRKPKMYFQLPGVTVENVGREINTFTDLSVLLDFRSRP